jgi:hypothetical protein
MMASGGNLQISPEGGGRGQVQIRLRIPKAEQALYKNAKRLIPAYIQKDGSSGRMPLGTNHWSGQDFVMEFRVSHFCQYEALVPGETLTEGWTGFQVESVEMTADRNGDGKEDVMDLSVGGCSMCPGDTCKGGVKRSFEVGIETTSEMKRGGEVEVFIAKVLKLKGAVEGSKSKTQKKTWTSEVNFTITHPYDLEKNAREEVDFLLEFAKVTLVDRYVFKNPLKKREIKVVLWIPKRVKMIHGPNGVCKFVKIKKKK